MEMWFVEGELLDGRYVTEAFETLEEAELWAATHEYANYIIDHDWVYDDLDLWDDDDDGYFDDDFDLEFEKALEALEASINSAA